MNYRALPTLCLLLPLSLLGCESRTDKTDGGGVLLSITDFDELPVSVGVTNAVELSAGFVQVGMITLENIPKDPTGVTSDLQNVEIQSYEVTYTRADNGTRVPPKLVNGLFGVVPVGGTTQYDNLPIMTIDQTGNPPLSDLLLDNGAVDRETGSDRIVLNFRLVFFGRTLSGDPVETAPAFFTITCFPALVESDGDAP